MWEENQTMDFMIGEPGSLTPVQALKQAYTDVKKHIGKYFVAGLGFIFAMFLLLLSLVLCCGIALAPSFFIENQLVSMAFTGLAVLVYTVGLLVIIFWYSPLYLASLLRSIAMHNRHGTPLAFNSVWKHTKTDRKNIVLVNFALQVLIMAGIICCVLPGLVIAALTAYAYPLVVLYRMPPMEALKTSANEVKSKIGWHALFYIISVCSIMCVAIIPVFGTIIAQPIMYRLYLSATENSFGHAPIGR